MSSCATPEAALAFVQEHGVVLASAKGAVPRLTEAIIGEPIKGSWWAHSKSHHIFAILNAVTESEQVLVCRLIEGKHTLVHRRLWSSLVCLANHFLPEQIAKVHQQHTPSGRHVSSVVPFPEWVPPEVLEEAMTVEKTAALAVFGAWLAPLSPAGECAHPPE
jgi:hypothetical protein